MKVYLVWRNAFDGGMGCHYELIDIFSGPDDAYVFWFDLENNNKDLNVSFFVEERRVS